MPSETIWTISQHRVFGLGSGDFFGLGLASKLFWPPPKMLGRLASSDSWASQVVRISSEARRSWRPATGKLLVIVCALPWCRWRLVDHGAGNRGCCRKMVNSLWARDHNPISTLQSSMMLTLKQINYCIIFIIKDFAQHNLRIGRRFWFTRTFFAVLACTRQFWMGMINY